RRSGVSTGWMLRRYSWGTRRRLSPRSMRNSTRRKRLMRCRGQGEDRHYYDLRRAGQGTGAVAMERLAHAALVAGLVAPEGFRETWRPGDGRDSLQQGKRSRAPGPALADVGWDSHARRRENQWRKIALLLRGPPTRTTPADVGWNACSRRDGARAAK